MPDAGILETTDLHEAEFYVANGFHPLRVSYDATQRRASFFYLRSGDLTRLEEAFRSGAAVAVVRRLNSARGVCRSLIVDAREADARRGKRALAGAAQ